MCGASLRAWVGTIGKILTGTLVQNRYSIKCEGFAYETQYFSLLTIHSIMKCCIIGAGATGGHLAVKLHRSGHQVSVIARGAQLAAIESRGLALEQADSTLTAEVRATANAADLEPQDLVFVTTKATALRSVAEHLRPLIGPDTSVVFLQNGMTWWYPIGLAPTLPRPPELPIFDLADLFLSMMRPDQVLGGIVYTANEVIQPGHIRNNSPSRNDIELASILGQETNALSHARGILMKSGLGSPPLDDIRSALWLKLVGNASSSSLCVATGNPAAIVQDPSIQGVFMRMLRECTDVAAAHGYPIADQLDLSRWTQHRSKHKPSMLQDYEACRIMEIDEILLAPVLFARSAGIDTPTLDAVTSIAVRLAADKGLYTARMGCWQ